MRFPSGTGGGVTYSSNAPEIAEVDASGRVTALSAGTATITVKSFNGKKAACTVRVRSAEEESPALASDDLLRVWFFNVGRNDGILISCGGEYAFIDSGTHRQGETCVKRMRALGVEHLKYYIGTHAHRDHVGGAPTILAAIPTDEVIMPHSVVKTMIRNEAVGNEEKAAAKAAKYTTLRWGESITLGSATFTCVGPTAIKKVTYNANAENINSLILRLSYGSRTILLTGDANSEELTLCHRADPTCLRADVLKSPHHYARLKPGVYKWISPRWVVFSTANNYQPNQEYRDLITSTGGTYYITSSNRNGEVRLITDGENIRFETKH